MRQRLRRVLMVTSIIAAFLSSTLPARSADGSKNSQGLTATTDENGHTVWVNDSAPIPRPSPFLQVRSEEQLAYWSSTEHRWKPVRGPSVRAARSAAAEVNQILRNSSSAGKGSISSFAPEHYSVEQVDAAIEQAAARHNLDPNLVRAVIKVESNFNPHAVSRKGAMGLMQLMPNTARQLNVTNPFDPEQNVDAGVRHLKNLLENYGGDVKLTLAAYNAGQRAVARSAGIPRFSETRQYVKRITDLYYMGGTAAGNFLAIPRHAPLRMERDERGVLHISNTD